ncbi:hypothetical protein, partial [Klebsiella grimontii]|uniref:hypothetical protein n=1 Tax=Klebsiella grimontii TaxID=2058152 RepID=UPI00292D396D
YPMDISHVKLFCDAFQGPFVKDGQERTGTRGVLKIGLLTVGRELTGHCATVSGSVAEHRASVDQIRGDIKALGGLARRTRPLSEVEHD